MITGILYLAQCPYSSHVHLYHIYENFKNGFLEYGMINDKNKLYYYQSSVMA